MNRGRSDKDERRLSVNEEIRTHYSHRGWRDGYIYIGRKCRTDKQTKTGFAQIGSVSRRGGWVSLQLNASGSSRWIEEWSWGDVMIWCLQEIRGLAGVRAQICWHLPMAQFVWWHRFLMPHTHHQTSVTLYLTVLIKTYTEVLFFRGWWQSSSEMKHKPRGSIHPSVNQQDTHTELSFLPERKCSVHKYLKFANWKNLCSFDSEGFFKHSAHMDSLCLFLCPSVPGERTEMET